MKKDQKQLFLDEIKTELTIKSVCKKLNISRQTVYRWLKEDKSFKDGLKKARAEGIEDLNDDCENIVIKKIREEDSGMVKFWLRYHHDDYKQSYIITK